MYDRQTVFFFKVCEKPVVSMKPKTEANCWLSKRKTNVSFAVNVYKTVLRE